MKSLCEVEKVEMDLVRICADIELHGVCVNIPYVKECVVKEEAYLQGAKDAFRAETGEEFRDSSKLFAKIFDANGERYPLTEKGNPSFKADFLEDCKTPTASLINTVRFHEKRLSTYFYNFLHYEVDGRIHPSMNQDKTKTGRFSYSNPNLQNVPKESDEEDKTLETNVRRSFTPPPGHSLVAIDYSQQEYKLMLDYAGETALLDAIIAGEDVHQATADLIGMPRRYAKNVNFAILYGAGIDKLASMIGKSPQEAKEIKRYYFSKLPKVKRLISEVKYAAERRGYIFNWLGRRFQCDDVRFSYKMPNALIQGSGADVIKVAMTRIPDVLGDNRMVLQVHDELLFYIRDEEVGDVVPRIKGVMESVYPAKHGVTLTTEASVSKKSWAHWDMEDLA